MCLHVSVQLTLCASVRVSVFTSPKFPADSNSFLIRSISCPLQPCVRLRTCHFSAGTQRITRRLHCALPAGISPCHATTGCPLSLPHVPCYHQSWKSPFPPGRLFRFPPRWMPLKFSRRVHCVTWLSSHPAKPT